MLVYIGKTVIYFLGEVGESLKVLYFALWHLLTGKVHLKNLRQQIVHLGYDSVPIILITAFFVGMVFAMQITKEFVKYGGDQAIGGVIAIAIWRELAPLLSAVIVSGRVGSAIAAEIGSMKVTEQVDVIKSFGIDEYRYLLTPRIWAITFSFPFLVVFFDVISLLGSYFMSVKVMAVNSVIFYNSVKGMPSMLDLSGGLIKALFFGMAIAVISCRKGLETEHGALGVGVATTKAVVTSLLTVFILNYFLSLIIYS